MVCMENITVTTTTLITPAIVVSAFACTVNISAEVSAEITVARDGDLITATVGRTSLSVLATTSPEKLIARRDRARADQSAVEVDDCDGHRTAVRSLASKVEEAQIVALLRFFGVTTDAPDAYALVCASDYAARVAGDNALPAPRAEAKAILAALADASRDETFGLLARASRLYKSAWINPTWTAEQAAIIAAKVAAEAARVAELPDDTTWGYAHGGTE